MELQQQVEVRLRPYCIERGVVGKGLIIAREKSVSAAMSLNDTTLRAYQATCLATVSQRWVEEAWETNFCETVNLPAEQEDALLDVLAWRGVVDTTRQWAKEEEGSRIAEGKLRGCFICHCMARSSFCLFPSPVSFLESSMLSRSVVRVGFWTVLFDAGVPHKCLLAVIFALLDREKPVRAEEEGRKGRRLSSGTPLVYSGAAPQLVLL